MLKTNFDAARHISRGPASIGDSSLRRRWTPAAFAGPALAAALGLTALGLTALGLTASAHAADFSLYQSNEVSTVVAGATTTYSLTVTNTSGLAQTGVAVDEVFDTTFFDQISWFCVPEFPSGHLGFLEARFDVPAAEGVAVVGTGLVYYSSPSTDTIKAFSRNPATGALTFVANKANGSLEGDGDTVSGLDGVRALAASPDGAFLYAASPVDDAVVVLAVGGGGTLDFVEAKKDGVAGVDGLDQATALVVANDHVYVVGASDDAVAMFARNPATGRLSYLGRVKDGQVQGLLTVDGLDGAAGIALSAGGEHVYVAGAVDGAVALWDRDLGTGLLTYRQSWNSSSVGELAGAHTLALSPEGDSLYVIGSSALVAFPRESEPGPDFGALGAPLQIVKNGVGGITGMAAPRGLVLGVAGTYLYLTSSTDHSLLVFVRDYLGRLTLLERRQDGVAGFDGLAGAAGLALSQDGAQLYVAGAGENAATVLPRSTETFCSAGGADNTPLLELHDEVELGVGARLHYTIEARLRSSGLGAACTDPYDTTRSCVSATASLLWPLGSADSTDIDYLSREADLAISIDDGVTSAVPGLGVVYSVLVENLGPSDAAGLRVEDFFPEGIESVSWTCAGQGAGASCGETAGSNDIDFGASILPAGTSLWITATADIAPGARGTVANTARVIEQPGLLDPVAANNVATEGDTVLAAEAELELVAMSQPPFYAGAPVVQTVEILNHGPSDALAVEVTGLVSGIVIDQAFTCEAQPEAGAPSLAQTLAALAGAAGGAVSPDGAHVYLAGHTPGSLTVLRRDHKDGRLFPIETIADGDSWSDPVDMGSGIVSGLIGARSVLVSPGGEHVYVASDVDDAVVLFRRDAVTGTLVYEAAYFDGLGGVSGLGGASSLALSPDGNQLYVAGTADDAVAIFSRNPAGGTLSFLAVLEEGIGGVSGLQGVEAIAVSPDGRHLYAASPGAGGVTTFSRAETGLLTFLATLVTSPPLEAGGSAVISQDGSNLYAVAGSGDALLVLARDASESSPTFGALSQLQALTEGSAEAGITVGGLTAASGVALSGDGRLVYTSGAGALGVFARQVDELLPVGASRGGLLCRDLGAGSCAGAMTGGDAGLFAFGNSNVYLPSTADHQLALVAILQGSRCRPSAAGALADSATVLANGSVTYTLTGTLISSAKGTVELAAQAMPTESADPGALPNEDGTSEPVAFKADLQLAKTDGLTTAIAGLPLTYDMTVTNAGPSDVQGITLADFYPIYPDLLGGFKNGTLSWSCSDATAIHLQQQKLDGVAGVDGLAGALQMAASPDGAHLYVAGQSEDALAIFTRDPLSGELTYHATLREGDVQPGHVVAGFDGVSAIALSPDGQQAYVTGEFAGRVAVLARDAPTGDLTFLRSVGSGIDGMHGAAGVLVSADGRNVYVTGKDDGAVVVFTRNGNTGDLTFLERERDGFGSVPPNVLQGAREMLLPEGGKYLLVAAQQSDALVLFERSPVDGSLTFLRALHDGDPQGDVAVDGLDMVFSLALSADQRFLYTAALADDAISRFAFDAATGELFYLGVMKNGVDGASALDGASAVEVSPDGRYLFAVAANSDALSIFARNGADGSLSRLELHQQGQGGLTGLDNPRGLLALGGVLYASAATSNSVVAFAVLPRSVCGSAGALGEAQVPFDLDAGASVTLSAAATVHPSARGNCDGDGGDLVSTLSAILPPGVLDETLPNEAIDGDDLRGEVGLALTLTDQQVTVAAGTAVSYTISITNSGTPSNSIAARVTSSASGIFQNISWTCTAGTGSFCAAAAGSGPIDVLVDVLLGSSITLQLSGTVLPSASGTLSQTVTVTPGPCESDASPADNTQTDRNAVIRIADLAISKVASSSEAEPGSILFYDITASNLGPGDAAALVSDVLPPELLRAVWVCTPSGSASCPVPDSGSGDLLAEQVTLPAGSEVTFTVAAEIDIAALGMISNSASIAATGGAIDSLQGNNLSISEVTLLDVVIFHGGFETGDTTGWEVFGLAPELGKEAGYEELP